MPSPLRATLLALLGGCTLTDVGTTCFVVPAEAGGRLRVTASLMSGDNPPNDFACQVDGEPNALTVHSSARSAFDASPFTSRDIAIDLTATCASPTLKEGPGSLTFAGETLDFVVPGDGVTETCFGGADRTPFVRDTDAADTGAADTDEADADAADTDADTDADTELGDTDVADTDSDADVVDTDSDTDVAPFCGDGRITGTEECDDVYDVIPYDGCTGCVVDNGWWCYGEPSYCVVL